MLIIEGGDLVGKTTKCHELLKDAWVEGMGYVYGHFSRLPDGFDRVCGYLAHATRRLVMDRFHMSEVVYARARGDATMRMSSEQYRLVDGYLRLLGSYTVVVTAEEDLIRERFADRDRAEMYDLDLILRANDLFHGMLVDDEYSPDWDAHCHVTVENPNGPVNFWSALVDKYCIRQMNLTRFLIDHGRTILL